MTKNINFEHDGMEISYPRLIDTYDGVMMYNVKISETFTLWHFLKFREIGICPEQAKNFEEIEQSFNKYIVGYLKTLKTAALKVSNFTQYLEFLNDFCIFDGQIDIDFVHAISEKYILNF